MYTILMSGSYIISNKGSEKPAIKTLLNLILGKSFKLKGNENSNPDICTIELPEEKKSIGILDIKKGVATLSEKPYQEDFKFLIIFDAERLTTEAQNSMLKTLEEPPSQGIIILVTKTLGALLDTVSSRCKKMTIGTNNSETDAKFEDILSMPLGQRLLYIEELSKEEKDTIIEFLYWTAKQQSEYAKKADITEATNIANKISAITNRIKDIENTNVTVRLALEELFLNL